MPQPRLQIEGVRELNRLLRAAGGRELQKELGKVHKEVGTMVISRLGGGGTGVGTGRGASIRPSAAAREVLLRVGGGHRDERRKQWGQRQVWPGGSPPFRPNLIGAAYDIEGRITDTYLDGVERILRSIGPS